MPFSITANVANYIIGADTAISTPTTTVVAVKTGTNADSTGLIHYKVTTTMPVGEVAVMQELHTAWRLHNTRYPDPWDAMALGMAPLTTDNSMALRTEPMLFMARSATDWTLVRVPLGEIGAWTADEQGYRKARAAAEARAEELLRRYLDAEQVVELDSEDKFTVKSKSGILYEIHRGRSGNVYRIDPVTRQRVEKFCAHPVDHVPDADTMLSQKLMIEVDEAKFIQTANRTKLAA